MTTDGTVAKRHSITSLSKMNNFLLKITVLEIASGLIAAKNA